MYLDDQSLGKQNEVVPPRKKISKGRYYEHEKMFSSFFFVSFLLVEVIILGADKRKERDLVGVWKNSSKWPIGVLSVSRCCRLLVTLCDVV